MKKIVLNIEGMTCSACSNGLEKYLNRQAGIKEASVNLVLATALIEYDETKLKKSDLERFVKEAGFKSAGENNGKKESKNDLKKIIVFVILAILQMYISMGYMINLPISKDNKYTLLSCKLWISFNGYFSCILIYGLDIIEMELKILYIECLIWIRLLGLE